MDKLPAREVPIAKERKNTINIVCSVAIVNEEPLAYVLALCFLNQRPEIPAPTGKEY